MRCAPALLTVSSTQLVESSERPAASQTLLPSSDATYPSSETDILRISEAMRCFLSGMDDTSCSSRWFDMQTRAHGETNRLPDQPPCCRFEPEAVPCRPDAGADTAASTSARSRAMPVIVICF